MGGELGLSPVMEEISIIFDSTIRYLRLFFWGIQFVRFSHNYTQKDNLFDVSLVIEAEK